MRNLFVAAVWLPLISADQSLQDFVNGGCNNNIYLQFLSRNLTTPETIPINISQNCPGLTTFKYSCAAGGKESLIGTIPTEIGNLANLGTFSVLNCNINGTIPTQIGNMTQLDFFYIANNQLTGTIPTQIGNMAQLYEFSIVNNQLNGTIPTQIGNTPHLAHFDVSYNQLTGTIPTQIGNMAPLEEFDVSYNQLNGTIPAEIGNMAQLNYFTIANNQLTGTIPTQIGLLEHLTYLGLTDNLFCGDIPNAFPRNVIPASLRWFVAYNGLNASTGICGNNSFTNKTWCNQDPGKQFTCDHPIFDSTSNLTFRGQIIYSVEFDESLTVIPDYAFQESSFTVKIIELQNTNVTRIGKEAFIFTNFHGSIIETISFPGTLKEIGEGAFIYCRLKSVDLRGTGVTELLRDTFSYASLEIIRLPEKLTDIGENVFSGCSALNFVDMPGVTTTNPGSFYQTDIRSLRVGPDFNFDEHAFCFVNATGCHDQHDFPTCNKDHEPGQSFCNCSTDLSCFGEPAPPPPPAGPGSDSGGASAQSIPIFGAFAIAISFMLP